MAQHWQTLSKELETAGQDNRMWKKFRQTLIQAYGNVLHEQVGRNKLLDLTQRGLVEAYATEFQLICAQITNLKLSMGDKSDRFVRGLKSKIRKRVVVDPFVQGGRWEDFNAYLCNSNGSHHWEMLLQRYAKDSSDLSLMFLSTRTRHMARPWFCPMGNHWICPRHMHFVVKENVSYANRMGTKPRIALGRIKTLSIF